MVHNLGNQAGVDHLLYFCASHFRAAIPRTEERAPYERKDRKGGGMKQRRGNKEQISKQKDKSDGGKEREEREIRCKNGKKDT